MKRPFFLLILVTLLMAISANAANAAGLKEGATCTLSREVRLHVRGAAGSLESNLAPGTVVNVLYVGDKGVKIETEFESGVVNADALELACTALAAGTYPECTLTGPLRMREKRRGKSRAFNLKEGAQVQILKRGRKLARLQVGAQRGYSRTERLDEVCHPTVPDGILNTATKVAPKPVRIKMSTLPELAASQRVLLVPFASDGNIDDASLRELEQVLRKTIDQYRSDVAGPAISRDVVDDRLAPLKPWLKGCFLAAKDSNVQFVITGRAENTSDGLELTLTLLDVAARKVALAVRARPRSEEGNAWANQVAASFDKVLPPSRPADGLQINKSK